MKAPALTGGGTRGRVTTAFLTKEILSDARLAYRRREHHAAFQEIIDRVRARHLVVSFSDEGYVTPDEVRAMLAARGEVRVVEVDYKRYVGAQIGIFNPRGEKVGNVGHLRNTEYIFIASELPLPNG